MNTSWQKAAEQQLGSHILQKKQLGGGDFADAYQATLADDRVIFIKTHRKPPAGFFSTEATGLGWLRDSGMVNVPKVLGISDEHPFLALEWVEIGGSGANTEQIFGRELAQLHQLPFSVFGRPDCRTTGSQAVPNIGCETWVEFYATQRLLPLAKLAHEEQALPSKCINMLEQLSGRLGEFGASDEPPSLLHGDLWAGNRVVDTAGNSWLIDPAAHGGHREFDLAMMQLFGGYGQQCLAAYNEYAPLQAGWQDRIALHQLAPLTVHAIKFGGSYRSAVHTALSKYV